MVRDVRDARESPFVTYLCFENAPMSELARRIKAELSLGRFVVVEGCKNIVGVKLTAQELYEKLHVEEDRTFDVHGE